MELLIAIQAVTLIVAAVAFARLSHRLNATERRLALEVERTQDSFYDVAANVSAVRKSFKDVIGVRDSMDQEIRGRQAAIDSVIRLVGRQSRAISHHIESNLH